MERNYQLDFFRGALLVLITIGHFLAENNIVRYFTYEFVGWVTAAEGFVFLSGLTAGLVYTYKMVKEGNKYISIAATKRAWLIYRNHALLLLFCFLVISSFQFARNYWSNDYSNFMEHPILAVVLGLALLYQPIYLDILPMYAVFMIFVPLIIKYFQKGAITKLLLLSFSLYLVGLINKYFDLTRNLVQSETINSGFFNLLCWQFLFVIGLLGGFLFYKGKTCQWQRNTYLFYVALGVSVGCFLIKNLKLGVSNFDVEFWAIKSHLGPLRLLNFFALSYVLVFVASWKDTWFKTRALCYLGRNSLDVFSFHIILVILFKPLKTYFNSLSAIKIGNYFYIYPVTTVFILFFIIPALYLAPTLLNRKTYGFA